MGYFLWFATLTIVGWGILYFPSFSFYAHENLLIITGCLILSLRYYAGSFSDNLLATQINPGITDNIFEGGTLFLCILLLKYAKIFPFTISKWFQFPTHYRIYIYCLLIIPCILIPVSNWNVFSEQYPKWRFNHIPQTDIASIFWFELSYIFDFIMVELFFRGWMLPEKLNRTFMPTVFLYMLFHFWKPFPEALGSIGGGIILGVFSRLTGNIWGGIILHCYLALLMEFLVT